MELKSQIQALIAEAVEVGKRIRRGAVSEMNEFASELTRAFPLPIATTEDGCGCSLI